MRATHGWMTMLRRLWTLAMTNTDPKTRPPGQAGTAAGVIDLYQDGALHGWAWDADRPQERVMLDVVIDGVLRETIQAGQDRPDLEAAGIGDGRYGYRLALHGYAREGAASVDIQFAGTGVSVARSPVRLDETYRCQQDKLRAFLDTGPFWLSDFTFDGDRLIIEGFYHPLHGDLSGVTLAVDGQAPVATEWHPAAAAAGPFWFLDPRSAGFRSVFDLGGMPPAADTSAVVVSLQDPLQPLGDLRTYHLPLSAGAYRNVPDAVRQKRVMGWAHDARFVMLGRTHYETNRQLAARHGTPLERMQRVLDWGTGCGRIARHFLAHHPGVEIHGVDIDADNIAWCSAHLPRGQFRLGPLVPPLPYPDDYFDLVHANSVFTHLAEDVQDAWLKELARILKPHGVALATIHSETAVAYARMPLEWIEAWQQAGIDSQGVSRDLIGFVGDEEYYRNTYHTYAYIDSHWRRHVDVLAIHKHLFGYQDVVVFRKPPASRTAFARQAIPVPAAAGRPDPMAAFERCADILIRSISNTIYGDAPFRTWGDEAFDAAKRHDGRDWPSLAHSMAGTRRLRNMVDLVKTILAENIPGDLIETGVWRGGTCILMKGLLAAWGDTSRTVFCADSFQGLPAPDAGRYPADQGDTLFTYDELAIAKAEVMANFERYGLLDARVAFVQGLFKETLPPLRGKQFALIRLDGDMYESTMDGLVNLYDTVPVGGFVVIDDYGAIAACKQAVTDFRASRNITDLIEVIDWTGVWWRKSGP